MRIELTNRSAVIFGAGTFGKGIGIGKAVALKFASCGATVHLVDCDEEAVRESHAQVTDAGGAAQWHLANVSDYEAVRDTVAVASADRPLDILFYNVGIGVAAPTETVDAARFDTVLSTNLTGLHAAVSAVLPGMREKGHGVILGTSSAWSRRHLGYPHHLYAASKAGLEHYLRLVGVDNGRHGVRTCAIAPGFIATPRVRETLKTAYGDADADQIAAQRAGQVPLGRLGASEDVANAAAFLASDLARYVTATELVVDGGLSAAPIAG